MADVANIKNQESYTSNVNYLGNLQLLGGTLNKEKNDKDFDEWLNENCMYVGKLKDYKPPV